MHEVGVRRHVAAVSMVTGTGRSLRVVVVLGDRRLGRQRPQVGGSVVLRGAVLAWRRSPPGAPAVLMERHDCGQKRSMNPEVEERKLEEGFTLFYYWCLQRPISMNPGVGNRKHANL